MTQLGTGWKALVERAGKIWNWLPSLDKPFNTLKNIVTTAATVGVFVYACFWESQTTFQLAQAGEDVVKLNVMTKAPPLKQSYARECRIHFDDLPIEDAALVPADDPDLKASVVISPNQPKVIALAIAGLLDPKCRKPPTDDQPDRFTKEEITPRIAAGHVTLTLSVQESGDGLNDRHEISIRIPAKALQLLIEHKLPEHIPWRTPSCQERKPS
jgi:hypothetical protein